MKKKAKGKSIYKKQDNIAGYVMLAPWMFGFLLMWLSDRLCLNGAECTVPEETDIQH